MYTQLRRILFFTPIQYLLRRKLLFFFNGLVGGGVYQWLECKPYTKHVYIRDVVSCHVVLKSAVG